MIDQYGRSLIGASSPAYSRTLFGPVESLDPRRTFEVTGELVVPTRAAPHGRYEDCWMFETERLFYKQHVGGHMLQDPAAREALERHIRRGLADEVIGRFTIPMHIREFDRW